MSVADPVFLKQLTEIVLADILLAGDNALVIALATRSLPTRQQFFGRMFGAAGAVGLRVLFVLLIGFLLKVPFLQVAGGVLLVWIATKLVRPQAQAIHEAGHPEEGSPHRAAATLKEAVKIIIIADITMSFDNVVAIANIAKGNVPLVVFGLLLSIPLVVWGSALIARLMERYRWIVWVGGAVLAHVAGVIIFADPLVLQGMGVAVPSGASHQVVEQALSTAASWVGHIVHLVPWAMAAVLFAYGWWIERQKLAEGRAEIPENPTA